MSIREFFQKNQTTLAICIVLSVLWSIPTICGYMASHPPDKIFLGWIRSDDFHRYGSFIDQTARFHRVLYKDYSTVKPQSPRMIAIYFLILGVIEIITGLSAQTLWFISKIGMIFAFVFVLKKFVDTHLELSERSRKLVLFFVVFSSGFEFFAKWLGISLPREKNFWMDGFSTFNTFHNPLKIAGISAGLLLVHWHLKYESSGKRKYLLLACIMILLLWAIHPNSAIPAYCALAALALHPASGSYPIEGLFRRWRRMLPYILPVFIVLLYVEWMKSDPMTVNIIHQYQIPLAKEPFWTYPFRYGIVFFLAIAGILSSLKRWQPVHTILAGWLAGGVIFAYHPFLTGLLFQHTIHLPMALFAMIALDILLTMVDARKKVFSHALVTLLIILFSIQNILVINKICQQTKQDVWPTSLYASSGELEVMKILLDLPPGNVFVNRDTGNKIAWLSLHNVFLGHWGTTPYKGLKTKLLKKFYRPGISTTWRMKILNKYDIRYIWYGHREKLLGALDMRLPIRRIARSEDVSLYRIERKKPGRIVLPGQGME